MTKAGELAGQALRESVAQLVYGAKKHSWPFMPGTMARFPQCAHCGETLYHHEPPDGWCYGFKPGAYETDHAGVLALIEAVRQRNVLIEIIAMGWGYLVNWQRYGGKLKQRNPLTLLDAGSQKANCVDGVPGAVCRAIVAALEGAAT